MLVIVLGRLDQSGIIGAHNARYSAGEQIHIADTERRDNLNK